MHAHAVAARSHPILCAPDNVGLSLNSAKTKIFSLDSQFHPGDNVMLVDTDAGFLEMARRDNTHKCLGKLLPGNLWQRGHCSFNHRLAAGWFKFHCLQNTLHNRHVSLQLRLKLFQATVSPTVLYSLTTTPLTKSSVSRLDAQQRKMIRKIIGWHVRDEDWHAAGSDMKRRLAATLEWPKLSAHLLLAIHIAPSTCISAFVLRNMAQPYWINNFLGEI